MKLSTIIHEIKRLFLKPKTQGYNIEKYIKTLTEYTIICPQCKQGTIERKLDTGSCTYCGQSYLFKIT